MSESTQKNPELRFPSFTNEWKYIKLSEITDVITKGTTPSLFDLNGEIRFVKIESIETGNINLGKCLRISNEVQNKELRRSILQKDDIVFSIAGTLGRVSIIKDDILPANTNQALSIIRLKKTIDPSFVSNVLHSRSMKRYIYENLSIGAQPNLSLEQVGNFEFFMPDDKEQRKIADFISLIDQSIENLEEKIRLLELQKKGIMQKMFNQAVKFKQYDGNVYNKWGNYELKDILEEKFEKTDFNNQYDALSSTTNGIFLQREYFRKVIVSEDNVGYKILRLNQIVFSPQNLWMGNINLNEKYLVGIVSPSYKVFGIKSGFYDKYIGFLLRTPKAISEFLLASEQGASVVRRNLNMEVFESISFKIPSYEEQKKIADFISTINSRIELTKDVYRLKKQYKKELLRKMFI